LTSECYVDGNAKLRVTTLRALCLDMIAAAGSGHAGVSLGFAPVIDALFASVLRIAPNWPAWPARDRFILSAGHASALLYATLFVHGFDVELHPKMTGLGGGARPHSNRTSSTSSAFGGGNGPPQ
jgi:transketolase